MKDVKVGHPMGFKFNVEDNIDIDKLLEISKVYHGDKYVIGRDDSYCQKPHYHIHFLCVKETSEGAMKTFRTNSIKKTFPNVTKSFRFYAGKDLPNADPEFWLAYAIKETQVKVSGFSITDEMLVAAKSHFQIKQMKQVKSESIEHEQKKKKEFRDKLFDWMDANTSTYLEKFTLPCYKDGKKGVINKYDEINPKLYKMMMICYAKEQGKTLLKFQIERYYIDYCSFRLNYDEEQMYDLLYGN